MTALGVHRAVTMQRAFARQSDSTDPGIAIAKDGLMHGISRDALIVKALALGQLAAGFVGSIVVARLAIARLGLDGFGDFAFLLGFAALLALSDLGMIPGLTSQIGDLLRVGRRAAAFRLVGVSCLLATAAWGILALGSLAWAWIALPVERHALLFPLTIFALSAALVSVADVGATLLRVGGSLRFTYVARLAYQLVWIVGVVVAYSAFPEWPGVTVLTAVQLIASGAYALAIAARAAAWRPVAATAPRFLVASLRSLHWRRAWRVSTPERNLRMLGALLALGERSLLLVMGAGAVLGSYDLLLRVCVLVSAIPAALAQPLLSMLAVNRALGQRETPFGGAAKFTARIVWLVTVAGLCAAVVVWVAFAETLFGVRPELPLVLALCVFAATALNVQTATGVAIATSEGVVELVNRKVLLEVAGIAVAVVVGLFAHSVLWFIGVRYAALAAAAIFFLVRFRRRGSLEATPREVQGRES
jgi:hypothetical protein